MSLIIQRRRGLRQTYARFKWDQTAQQWRLYAKGPLIGPGSRQFNQDTTANRFALAAFNKPEPAERLAWAYRDVLIAECERLRAEQRGIPELADPFIQVVFTADWRIIRWDKYDRSAQHVEPIELTAAKYGKRVTNLYTRP